MTNIILFFLVILNIGTVCFAWLDTLYPKPSWDTLRVTWGIPIVKENAFDALPLNVKAAVSAGFTKISKQCSGTYEGNRYLKENDTSVILLYDVNGYIAGIQTAVPKSLVQPLNKDYQFNSSAVYQIDNIHGHEVYILTAYFVDPDKICIEGRGDSDIRKEGIGSGIYLRNGATYLKISKKHADTCIADPKWRKGGCLPSAGQYYWYNVRENQPRQEFLPFFLLYNRGKLTGFGFVWFGQYTFSNRFEHPPNETIDIFINPVPKFLPPLFEKIGGVTTLHVFFNVAPYNLLC